MASKYYDLDIHSEDPKILKIAEHLGWGGICIVKNFDSDFIRNSKEFRSYDFPEENHIKKFPEKIKSFREKFGVEILIGAEINAEIPGEIQKRSRSALEYADIILVSGGGEGINRAASECWEIDILCHPEKTAEKDRMDYKSSGINQTIAKFMSERFIAIEINFSEILNSGGILRSQILGRMRQNLVLAKKYNIPVIITSGAKDIYGLRAPRELIAFGISLGMDGNYAKNCVEKTPELIIKKAMDRKNPNVIMKGLEVVSWGNLTPMKKKMYGWY